MIGSHNNGKGPTYRKVDPEKWSKNYDKITWRKPVTIENELISVLEYNPESGVFTWNDITHYKRRPGTAAGCVSARDGYVRIVYKRKSYLAHRIALLFAYGEFPKSWIDHKNGIKTDNRLDNLRIATKAQNNQNRRHRKSSSGFIGVMHRPERKKPFCAKIGKIWLGSFSTATEAAERYDRAAIMLYGLDAQTNSKAGLLKTEQVKNG